MAVPRVLTGRRVVTGQTEDGRSTVASDGPAPTTWCAELWATAAADPLGSTDEPYRGGELLPPPGGTRWRLVELAPEPERRGSGRHGGVAEDGWHRTETVDYVLVLDGDLVLELEEGRVVLHPGDLVVQRATTHAWRNEGDGPVRLLAVMVDAR